MNLIPIYINALEKNIWIRPGTDDEIAVKDTFQGLYHIPPENIAPEIVFDIGSNIGLTVAHYEKIWPEALIIGFELDKDNWLVALKNTKSAIYNIGISHKNGWQKYSKRKSEISYFLDENGNENVYCVTLDNLVKNFKVVDFVKMDIEGEETKVLNSGEKWQEKIKSILVEVHNGFPLEQVEKMLLDRGYTCERHLVHWSAIWAKK